MTRQRLLPSLLPSLLPGLLLSLCAACASATGGATPMEASMVSTAGIAHDVYFTFEAPTDELCDGLVVACERLRDLHGVVHLTVGRRDESQMGGPNETQFHVGLHVEFADQAAYDAYSPHATHQALVEEFVKLMSKVVVYDSLLGS